MKKILKRSRILLALILAIVMVIPSVVMAAEQGHVCGNEARSIVAEMLAPIGNLEGLYIARTSDDYYVLVNPAKMHMFEGIEIISLDASCEDENEIRPFQDWCCNNMHVYTWNQVPIVAWAGGPQIGWRLWQRCAGCRANWPTLTVLW